MPPIDPIKQGHGFQRTLIFSLLELYAELNLPEEENGIKNILMIEEPEIYMHPQMQRKMADLLYKLSDSGKIQIICGTHSPIFIKLEEKQKTLARIFKDENNNLSTKQVDSDLFSDGSEEKSRLRVIMDFNPYINELFFSKRVVLLEGDTEFINIPKVLNILKDDDSNYSFENDGKINPRDVNLINCKSRDSIPTFQKVLNHFGIKYLVIHDLECEKFDEGTNKKILDLLDKGESQRKYFEPDFESVIGIENKGSAKWFKAMQKIEEMDKNDIKVKLEEYINFVYKI
jgi:predicted ATP-dependent endonuclease of OLD family